MPLILKKRIVFVKILSLSMLRTFFLSRKITTRSAAEFDCYTLKLADASDLPECFKLYADLHDGNGLSKFKKLLYRLCSGKVIIAAYSKFDAGSIKKIYAVDMYYVNKRDAEENTVHEGFIGVLPEAEGKGLATQMRSFASTVFHDAGLSGISTRISEDNIASMKSAKKQGFKVVERYFDETQGKFRCYMKKTF
ncbi:GNAT family N-acetyltransferase [Halomonas mongoliensis]|uniref:GNAT family N-acetyltransferase n=1 Tax=Halomonas mongoliensis TaxID=321265 RepID=UPI00403A98C7